MPNLKRQRPDPVPDNVTHIHAVYEKTPPHIINAINIMAQRAALPDAYNREKRVKICLL